MLKAFRRAECRLATRGHTSSFIRMLLLLVFLNHLVRPKEELTSRRVISQCRKLNFTFPGRTLRDRYNSKQIQILVLDFSSHVDQRALQISASPMPDSG